jgi:ligand-binding SRPBCC domain-containing protein
MWMMMKLFRLNRIQFIPIPISDAWRFFSDPRNLQRITPPWLNFKITCDVPEQMYPGMLLTYTVKAIAGIPMNWITEITHVREPFFFVDEQRFGPYRFWHHQHRFKETDHGVEMRDIVHYALSFGLLDSMINHLFISGKLAEIFSFRKAAITQIFGADGMTEDI